MIILFLLVTPQDCTKERLQIKVYGNDSFCYFYSIFVFTTTLVPVEGAGLALNRLQGHVLDVLYITVICVPL